MASNVPTTQTNSSVSGSIANAGDAVDFPISGAQFASARVSVDVGGTATLTALVSIDGGTNWLPAPLGKDIKTVSANPSVIPLVGVALPSASSYEVPIPANCTHVRVLCAASGAPASVTISTFQPYVPGTPVCAVLYDATSAPGADNNTGILDFSGWAACHVNYSSGGATTGNVVMGQDSDDAIHIGGGFNIMTGVAAGKLGFGHPGLGSGAQANIYLTKRCDFLAQLVAAQQTRLRIEAFR